LFAKLFGAKFAYLFEPSTPSIKWREAGSPIIAYLPKGASSLATSYVNLANPGTYDATVGVAPTWNASSGWIFNGSTQYLDTGVEPASDWSMVVKFSDFVIDGASAIAGITNYNVASFFIASSVGQDWYGTGKAITVVTRDPTLQGVRAISKYQGYLNGVADGTPASEEAWANTGADLNILIGCYNYAGGSPAVFSQVNVQAFTVYDKTLSAAEILAVTQAMEAI